MNPSLKIYLAGPDVFLPNAKQLATEKKRLCTQYGLVGLHPLDQELATGTPTTVAMAIYQGNHALMAQADAIIADLTPFRGPSADAGTVFELGFMLGRGRPAFGYSRDATLFTDRTIAANPGATRDTTGRWSDAMGAEIEDFQLHDNLMIDCALRAGHHPLITPPADLQGDVDLWCFEQCLKAVSALPGGG